MGRTESDLAYAIMCTMRVMQHSAEARQDGFHRGRCLRRTAAAFRFCSTGPSAQGCTGTVWQKLDTGTVS